MFALSGNRTKTTKNVHLPNQKFDGFKFKIPNTAYHMHHIRA